MRTAVVLVVVLALLGGTLVAGDHLLRTRTQTQLEEELREHLPGVSDDVRVRIGGTVFLPQVLAGRIDQASMTASQVQVDAFVAQDVRVALRGVSIAEPYRAESMVIDAVAPAATLQALIIEAGAPDGVTMNILDGDLTARASLLGLPIEVVLVPEARGRSIGLSVGAVSLSGAQVDADELPTVLSRGLSGIEVELEELPRALELHHIEVLGDGVAVQVRGTDVVFDEL